jgi:hypothetical protein
MHSMKELAIDLPDDLNELASEEWIVRTTLEVVARVEWPAGTETFSTWDRTPYRAPILLTLLTYSYARGIFPSEEIRQRLYRDPVLHYLCCKEYPDEEVLRAFRRKHERLLEQCVGDVLMRAWAVQISRNLAIPDIDLPPLWAFAFRLQAEQRLLKASFFDSMEAVVGR